MPENAAQSGDNRTAKQVMAQHRKFVEVKRALIKDGHISGDATPAEVIVALRKLIPPGTFD